MADVLINNFRNTQETADNLNPAEDSTIVLEQNTENLKLREGVSIISSPSIGNAFIFGHDQNGKTGTGPGVVLGMGTYSTGSDIYVVNPNNTFKEYFYTNIRIDETNSDGTQDLTNGTYTLTGSSSDVTTSTIGYMYIIGTQNDKVYQYQLSDPFQISSSTFVTSVAAGTTVPPGIFVGNSGNYMYIVDYNTEKIMQYSLANPYMIQTSTLVSSLSLTGHVDQAWSVKLSPDGTKLYHLSYTPDELVFWTLSTPWMVSSGTFHSKFDTTGAGTDPVGFAWKPDGSRVFVHSLNQKKIFEYDVSIPWYVTSMSYGGNNLSITSVTTTDYGFEMSPDGTKFYIMQNFIPSTVYQFNMSVPWRITSGTLFTSYSIDSQEQNPYDLCLNSSTTTSGGGGGSSSSLLTKVIAKNNVTYSRGTLSIIADNTSGLKYYSRFDGTNWEEMTPDVELVSTHASSAGIDLKVYCTSGTSVISFLQFKYS